MRLIDVDEIKYEAHEKLGLGIDYGINESDVFYVAYKHQIDSIPTIDLVKWIPTTEKLPSEGENVLLCSTLFGNVAIGKLIRYNTSCCWEVDHWDCDIEDWQAWMPLPEPYRKVE